MALLGARALIRCLDGKRREHDLMTNGDIIETIVLEQKFG
jgi:hypothetical protein